MSDAPDVPAVARLLGLPSMDELLAHWGEHPLVSPGPASLAGFIDGDLTLGGLLEGNGVPASAVTVLRYDPAAPTARKSLAPSPVNGRYYTRDLLRLVNEGWSVMVKGIDRYSEGCRRLRRTVSLDLCCITSANLFVSPPRAAALGCHADSQDTFFVQLSGGKEWQVHDREPRAPLRVGPSTAGRLIMYATLQAGGALHVPAFFPHAVAASAGEISVSLSFAVYAWSAWELVSVLCNRAPGSDAARNVIPGPGARYVTHADLCRRAQVLLARLYGAGDEANADVRAMMLARVLESLRTPDGGGNR